MKKQYVQGTLCVIAIIHLYLYGPSKIEGTIGDYTHAIYYMAWDIKRLLQIPFIYGFLILAVQFLWPSGRKQSVSETPEDQQTGEQPPA